MNDTDREQNPCLGARFQVSGLKGVHRVTCSFVALLHLIIFPPHKGPLHLFIQQVVLPMAEVVGPSIKAARSESGTMGVLGNHKARRQYHKRAAKDSVP